MGFQFVSVGNTGLPKNANDRKIVRKVAMQAFRRRERIERVNAFAVECATATKAKAAASPAVPLGDPSIESPKPGDFSNSGPTILQKKSSFPNRYNAFPEDDPIFHKEVLSPATDPYRPTNKSSPPKIPQDLGYLNNFSYGDTLNIGYLFDYFISEIIPTMLPFDGHNQRLLRIYWSRHLIKDPVILQAALSHAAIHMDTANRKEPSQSATMHTKSSIRLINQRLSSKSFIVDNNLIVAVAIIASNSNLTGDLVESQIHIDALKEMVRLKGGRDNLGPDTFLHALLSWADVTLARLARSRPRFAPARNDYIDRTSTLAAAQSPLCHTDEIFGLIGELRKLTDLKQRLDYSNTATIADLMAFDTQRNALEERVLCIQYTVSTTRGLGFGDIILDACCIAASIYMSRAFRKFDAHLPILRTVKHDLMAAILKAEILYTSLSDLPGSEFPYAESLLWVLVVGGSLALDPFETTWFAKRLSLVVPWTQVRSWEEAEACLKALLWMEKLQNEVCESMWNEMEERLGFKDTGNAQRMKDGFDAQILSLKFCGLG